MTIAAGFRCTGGVVFGADTDENVGEMRRRVFKIPQLIEPFCTAIITGGCDNGHLMDAFVERIFDKIKEVKPQKNNGIDVILKRVALTLYREEFAAYPDQSTRVELLVATKLPAEHVEAWSIKSSVVRRMHGKEIVGCGELIGYLFDRLYRPDLSPDDSELLMIQLVSMAKKKVSGVGGETYVSVLTDDRLHQRNVSFSPELEELFDYFMSHSGELILGTGNKGIDDKQYQEILSKFAANMKWYREKIPKPYIGA